MRIHPSFRLPARTLLTLFAAATAHATAVTTITASASTLSVGTTLTLTSTVKSGSTNISPSTVSFCDASITTCRDSGLLGTAQVTSSNTAIFRLRPGIGTHTYKAIFAGTAAYASSSSSTITVTVTGTHPTLTAITSTGTAGAYTLTSTVTSTGSPAQGPTGTATFYDGSNSNYSLGSATLGTSTLTQALASATSSSVGSNPRVSATGDFNNDGIPDLAVSSQGASTVTILLGNGDGTFTQASGSPLSSGNNIVSVVTGDFNNDGNIDLISLGWGDNSAHVFLGNGDGTFQASITGTPCNEPSAIAIGDFNRDGILDAVVASQSSNQVTIFIGDGTGNFSSTQTYNTGSQPYSIAIGDLNGDGYLDLVIGNANASSVTVLLGSGSGTFSSASGSPVTIGSNPLSVVLADINNDGKLDVIAADSNDNNISIIRGNGNGTFQTVTSVPLAAGTKRAVVADFNKDGNQDLAVCNYSLNTVALVLGNGNNTFQTAQTFSAGSTGCAGLVTADFNGDGLPDIEVALQGNSTSVALLNTYTQTAAASISSVSIPGSGSHNIYTSYPGDTLDSSSTSSNLALTASPITTTLTLASAPASSAYGQQVALSATLSPWSVGGLTTSGETITFFNSGTSIGTATLSGGVAQLNITSLPTGTDSLTASYPTDSNFLASTSSATNYSVGKSTPTISWSTPAGIVYGTALSATQLNATSNGVAGTFTYSPVAGTVLNVGTNQSLTVAFVPTNTVSYNNASGSTNLTVTQAAGTVVLATSSTPAGYGATVTLTATLPSGATGNVTFLDNGSSIGTSTLSGTTAVFTTSNLAIGSHPVTASWAGNANLTSGISSVLTQVIAKSAATITAASTLNPALYGDAVSVTYTFSGGGVTPTGTATITDAGVTLATLTLNGSGVITYTAALLTTGTHNLIATYNGDSHYF